MTPSTPRLTAIFIKDKQSAGYTAFVEEMPAAVTQGRTLKEAKDNLLHALSVVLNTKRRMMDDNSDNVDFWKRSDPDDLITEDLNITLQ